MPENRSARKAIPSEAAAGTASRRGRAARRDNAERRLTAERELVEAAIRLIAEKGLSEITLAEIGERAGYSRGLPAYYFGSKDGLLPRVIERIAQTFEEAITMQAQTKEADLESFLDATVRLTSFATEQLQVYAVVLLRIYNNMVGQSAFPQSLGRTAVNINHRLTAMLTEKIRHGIAQGYVDRRVNPKATAMLILATQRGLFTQQLIDPASIDFKMMRREFANLLRQGLAMVR